MVPVQDHLGLLDPALNAYSRTILLSDKWCPALEQVPPAVQAIGQAGASLFGERTGEQTCQTFIRYPSALLEGTQTLS